MSHFVSINPTTGREIGRTPALSQDAIESAVSRAQAEQGRWRATPFRTRAALLSEVARQLELDAKDLAALMSREVGKPFREALAEVKKCAWTARHFAEHGPAMLGDETVDTEARRSFVRHVPLGVILAIMPWNFPFWQVFRFAIPAMLAGNTVLLKHAPSTMGCAAAIEALMRKAGAARGLLQNLPITVELTGTLITDPRIAAVTFTGSTRAGCLVASMAGAFLKPCVLELGGNDPFIVMPSADLEQAIELAVRARVQNNGQSCIAAKRFIIHEAVYPAFEKGMTLAMTRLRCGDPMDESVDLGPLASEAARSRLQGQVDAALEAGGRLLLGGSPTPGPGYFYPPTLITDLPHDAAVGNEELFGPVALLYKVPDLNAALWLANATPYGLSSSIWTNDEDEAETAIDALDVGSVFVNGMPRSDPRLPFGGVKASGFGRELGREGLLAFTSARTIWQK